MRKAAAENITKFMENEVFPVFGVPQFIICDNGTQFAGRVFKKLTKTYEVQKIWYNARYQNYWRRYPLLHKRPQGLGLRNQKSQLRNQHGQA